MTTERKLSRRHFNATTSLAAAAVVASGILLVGYVFNAVL